MRSMTKVKIEDVWPGDLLEMEQGFRRRVVEVRTPRYPELGFNVDLILSERDGYKLYWPCNWDETVWVVR